MSVWSDLGFSEPTGLTADEKRESRELNRADERLWQWAKTDIGPRIAKLLGGTGTKLKKDKEFKDMEWILLLDENGKSMGHVSAETSLNKPYRPILTLKLGPEGIERLMALLTEKGL